MTAFSVLGGIEMRVGGKVFRPGGAMQQTLLAVLLVHGGTVVTADTLMGELWGPTPPKKVENALQAQISRIRRSLAALEPQRTDSRVATSTSGYLLELDRDELDAQVFLDTVDGIRGKVEQGLSRDVRADADALRAALGQWRGPVFGGLSGGPICQTAAARLVELKHAANALLYELELRAGRHEWVLPELIELYARNPSHERLCILLMRAFYRSGRQLDALNVYRQCRRSLVETLGIEPSPLLAWYERAILTHDPALLADDPAGRFGSFGPALSPAMALAGA